MHNYVRYYIFHKINFLNLCVDSMKSMKKKKQFILTNFLFKESNAYKKNWHYLTDYNVLFLKTEATYNRYSFTFDICKNPEIEVKK